MLFKIFFNFFQKTLDKRRIVCYYIVTQRGTHRVAENEDETSNTYFKSEREVLMEKMQQQVEGMIPFPCHKKEKVFVYKGARGHCSLRCPSCDQFALFDFGAMTATATEAAKGQLHQIISAGRAKEKSK